ncbi:MAG: hypothetical protein Q9227_000030 [Pyrenula ochraceoflavens]
MPPKRASSTPMDRKRQSTESAALPNKKAKIGENASIHKISAIDDAHGVVLRQFYPPEMTNSRCDMYNNGQIEKPLQALYRAKEETKKEREAINVRDAVVHWFKTDIRTLDNHSLHLASQKALEKGVPLICLYTMSPQDFQAHLTSPVRIDFILRSLEVLQRDLAQLDIPLFMVNVEKRKTLPDRLIELCKQWRVNHVYTNIEYEVDELRREAELTCQCLDAGISFNAVADTCVVEPGKLSSQSGTQFSVYSPWYRAWVRYLNERPRTIDPFSRPQRNPVGARKSLSDLFDCSVPEAPTAKKLSLEEKQRFRNMWPPGEHEANERLEKFIKTKISQYKDRRNLPAENGTAVVSVHLAAGTLSARTAVRAAREANSTEKIDGGNIGCSSWISEIAWRDFYKHVLARWPYVCMNKSFKPEYTNIRWEYDLENFKAWCEGRTGFPIVDAAMRQLNHTGYMHNRCRMIVASFLAKDLLIDWRMGERYFMEHLVDGDFASNNGGWGFSASTGVDPQPYFRIFNPTLQSEKFDPDGKYIRKWVPELEGVKGKAIHDPFGRGAENTAKKNGYPPPIVDHSQSRARALARYKEGIGRDTA